MIRIASVLALSLIGSAMPALSPQGAGNLDAVRGKAMLRQLRATLEREYYDPSFGGRNLDALFAPAEQRIGASKNANDVLSALALPLLDLEDSHTFFVPPSRATRVEYGWEMAAVGDGVFVHAVQPGSDAAAKGLKPGDRVLLVNNQVPARDNLWKLRYIFQGLRPQPALVVKVQRPDGSQHDLTLRSKVTQLKRVLDLTNDADWQDLVLDFERSMLEARNECKELSSDTRVCRMPEFAGDPASVDTMIERSKGYGTLVLDLRGNGGGAVDTLERLAAHLLGPGKAIATLVERSKREAHVTRGVRQPFEGKLIVLTDSRSASAAEVLAALVKHYARGTVIGDRTAGAVMVSIVVPHRMGVDRVFGYAMSVTVADLLLPDGTRLERAGSIPHEVVLPTAADMAAGRDPVLSRAAALAGITLSAEDAGKLFPREWRR